MSPFRHKHPPRVSGLLGAEAPALSDASAAVAPDSHRRGSHDSADPPSGYEAIETLIATCAELVDDGDFAGNGMHRAA